MLLLLNGPFGIGKTTTAQLVAPELPGFICDPELVGTLVGVMGLRSGDQDYRELPVWRDLVVEAARSLRRHVAEHLVLPMNLLERSAHDELVARLQDVDDVVRVRLTASADVLRERILARPDEEGPHEWCLRHLDADVAAAADPRFGIEVRTDGRTPEDVARDVLRVARQSPGGGSGVA